jgi:hypothetical protein
MNGGDGEKAPKTGGVLSHWFAALVVAVVVVYGCVVSYRHSLWLDEIATFLIAASGSVRETWHLLATGTQSDPPLFYLASRASMAVLGKSTFAFRLPSVLGVAILGLSIYLFVAARCPLVVSRLAMLTVLLPPVTRYVSEGRPYGLWMGLSGLVLLCWQRAGDVAGARRLIWLLGLALFSVASVATHFYAVLFLAAIGVAELYRTWSRGRLLPGVWLALGFGGVPLVILRPLIAHAKAFVPNAWARPGWGGAFKLYKDLFQGSVGYCLIFMTLTVLAAVLWRPRYIDPRETESDKGTLPLTDLAAALVIVCLPCFGFVLAKFYTNNLHLRYVLPTTCGLAILVAVAVQNLTRGRAWIAHSLVVLTGLLLANACMTDLANARADSISGAAKLGMVQEASRRADDAAGILLTTSPSVLMEAFYYRPDVRVVYACGFRSEDNYDEITRHASNWCTIMERQDLAKHDCYLIVPEIVGPGLLRWFMDKKDEGWHVVPKTPLSGGQAVFCARRVERRVNASR